MQVTGAKRNYGRLTATTGVLLIFMAAAAGADSFGSDGDSASAAPSRFAMAAADIGRGLGEVTPTPDAPLAAAAVAVDRSTASRRDGEDADGQDAAAPTFLDQLVTQYFESYN